MAEIVGSKCVVLEVQRFGVRLVIERSLVRLPAGALSSQLNSAFHPYGVGKSSTGLHGWGYGGVCSLVSVAGNTVHVIPWQVTSRSHLNFH